MTTAASTLNTPSRLLRVADGLILHHALCAAASLGVADLIGDGSSEISELAAALRVNDEAFYRILRYLSAHGVFHEEAPKRFANSEVSRWLRSDLPGSIRNVLAFRGSSYFVAPLSELCNVIATGIPAHNAFDRLRQDPEEARLFDEAMTEISAVWAPAIAAAYDFGKWQSVMDLGGGNGLILSTILRAHPALRGVLADQAHVLERARGRDFWSGIEDRVSFEPVDFFRLVPNGCRAYLLRNVIHDWNDKFAGQILNNCRRAIREDGVLLLVEYSIGKENQPSMGNTVDIIMLASTGGKERTVQEHRELLAASGFQLRNVIPLENDALILEAQPLVN